MQAIAHFNETNISVQKIIEELLLELSNYSYEDINV